MRFRIYYQKKPPGLEGHYGIRIGKFSGSIWLYKKVIIFGWEKSYE